MSITDRSKYKKCVHCGCAIIPIVIRYAATYPKKCPLCGKKWKED